MLFLILLILLRYVRIFMALNTILIWVWLGLLMILSAYGVKSGHFAETLQKYEQKYETKHAIKEKGDK